MPASPDDSPILARPLRRCMQLIPTAIHSTVISRLLNILLARNIQGSELDFLENKTMHVQIDDAATCFSLSLHRGALIAADRGKYDLSISGSAYNFMLLVSRREDADTLFFQRQLKMEGDTELGLYVKNFLDGLDVESLPFYKVSNSLLLRSLRLYEHIFSAQQRLQMLRSPLKE